MPSSRINGLQLYWEQQGQSGPAVVFVHGSWTDHRGWDLVRPSFAGSFRVVTYDRRGHSRSERPPAQGRLEEDVADLAALIRALDLAPAHVVGNSFGGVIALRLAAAQPDLLASLVAHEPPFLGLLHDHPAIPALAERIGGVIEALRHGRAEEGARQFVDDVALGPHAWETLPRDMQQTFILNAPTFLDEVGDPDGPARVDLERLSTFREPVLLTRGDASPAFYEPILETVAAALPQAERHTFVGAGHVPHLTQPEAYVDVVGGFLRRAAGAAPAGRALR